MQSSLYPDQITVLGIACNPADGDRFAHWLGDSSRYRWMLWESDDSFALAPSWPPELILLGQAAGIGSLAALAAQWPAAEVIVILEREQESEAALWLDQGADDYWVSSQISSVRVRHTVQRLATQARVLEHRIATRTAELRQAKRTAEMANRINHQLMADLSQDLKTPLEAILRFSQLLLKEACLSPQHRQALDTVYTSSEGLLSLINSTLTMTQPEPAASPVSSFRRAVALAPGSPACRILIVEDDFISRVLIQALLAPLGFELQVATSGRDAIVQWADWQPHLVCIALTLADLDGYETVRHLRTIEHRQLRPETPPQQFAATQIIALTDSDRDDAFRMRAAGCNDWVEKPVQPDVILEKIANCLALKYVYASEPDLRGAVQPAPNSTL
ncbi:response regulator [Leptolyngbya sp. CCNP1308]|uniref:response regulator n=1 Tax=Leptolyngbya sp. CCNP1308 TaxID=3110255 RepID=UPI002B1FFAEB|nr:response regulator [Leptolyngbya sp. CCNP1308]MEA5448241.1 response regulator [Leptolyngbya sp. CCNP1308]